MCFQANRALFAEKVIKSKLVLKFGAGDEIRTHDIYLGKVTA